MIKSLMQCWKDRTGVIRPTFEEYPNRYSDEKVVFEPTTDDFSYTVDDIIDFYGKNTVDNLLLVNPDNPTGNYLCKKDVLKLVAWCKEKKIHLLVDESFVDFADELDSTIIDEEILEANKHLAVMKSISKSYGVPGLRFGVLASGDTELISFMKKDVAIWNINSFAEFYMQIEE